MNILLKLWFIALAFIHHTKISYQDCGERFINEDDLSRKSRIIGGHEAAVNSWPWLVNFVSYKNKSFQVCSGNLIDPQWILTTAHCFVSNNFQFPVDKWTYIAGDHYLNKIDPHEQILYPEELYIHPNYTLLTDYSPGDYDIALIRLKKPAMITSQVRTICLPNNTDDNVENKTHFVAGWGNIHDSPEYKRSHFLKELRMSIIPQDVCNKTYGGNVTQRQLCAAHPNGGEDACFGDSGGPLQYMNEDGKWVLSGTVSWGRGCARKNFYGVYTDIKALMPYVNKVLKSSTTCGVRNKRRRRPKRIVGGKEASLNGWPWTVNIIWKDTQQQGCGGSIIASNWILTSAHCFPGRESFEKYEYHVGDHILEHHDKGQKKIVPEYVYIHPDYIPPSKTDPGNFDIALVKLKYSLEWNDVISPICLPDNLADLPPAKGLSCYAVGWGNTEDKLDYKRPKALKELRVNVISHDRCNSNISYNGSVPETYFCAGFPEGLNDTCYGDSGGPLQCNNDNDTWSIRGIVSWGIGCARPNKFGVYLNVSKFMPFINKVMSGQDLRLRRFEMMTLLDIYNQKPSPIGYLQLCSWTVYEIIQYLYPDITNIDIVRSWALIPSEITTIKIASPNDLASAYKWDLKTTCKSKTMESILTEMSWSGMFIYSNNDTLNKFAKHLNLTVDMMAFLLRRTISSLLLSPTINFKQLKEEINQAKLVEKKVSRLIELVDFLKILQPGIRLNEQKLKEIVRNFTYKIAKNLTDDSLRGIISTNHIHVFTKYIPLKNLGVFFGNQSLDDLKQRQLSDIIVNLTKIDLKDVESQFLYQDMQDFLDSRIWEVENFWRISAEWLTLEKLLIASKLMKDKFDCNHCDVNSEYYVFGCDVVCVQCIAKECNPVNIIDKPGVANVKLALIFGVFSGCLVAVIIILLICFISKQHRLGNTSTSEKVMTDEELEKSTESLRYKTTSNNNIVYLPQSKAINGKSGSYVALESCDNNKKEETRCNGNLESIL